MATFKVGDRVRLVYMNPMCTAEFRGLCIGAQGTITSLTPSRPNHVCEVEFDHFGLVLVGAFSHLAPLTPPAADEWAQSKVREVTKPVYTEPERVRDPQRYRNVS